MALLTDPRSRAEADKVVSNRTGLQRLTVVGYEDEIAIPSLCGRQLKIEVQRVAERALNRNDPFAVSTRLTQAHQFTCQINIRDTKIKGFIAARSGTVQEKQKSSHRHRVDLAGAFDSQQEPKDLDS